MRVCVVGLWHLGIVTACSLASIGHAVVGLDFEPSRIASLRSGQPPVFEPHLQELLRLGIDSGSLSFTTEAAEAVFSADVVWITYDTPVDDDDQADIEFVLNRTRRLFPHLREGSIVLISSQVPVGTTRRLASEYAAAYSRRVGFAYSPENLRLGNAIAVFTGPDRVVVGASAQDRQTLQSLFGPVTSRIEWMSIESAEMVKHALNAFLATSVAFMNEIATICEQVGADAKEVERGLKSESRIGSRAYLSPGSAFAGGTLARDTVFLRQLGEAHDLPTRLFAAVKASNDAHRSWPQRRLAEILGDVRGQSVAIWGLTYKPGTDTLRRSPSVELCYWLESEGARIRAHDPVVRSLDPPLRDKVILHERALDALDGASALVVGTSWPEYSSVTADQIVSRMRHPLVLDANRFLAPALQSDPRIRYAAVGTPLRGGVVPNG